MKELTIEQKAKAYDEAIRKAKDMLSYKEVRQEDIEYLFPELVESEDERIRKALIDFFNRGAENGAQTNGVYDKDILAWLKKQKSVEEIVERCKKSWYNEGKIQGMREGLSDDEKYQQGWHDALEKQGEKPQGKTAFEAIKEKPADNANKVEPNYKPKFNIADWVVWDNKISCHIDNIYQVKESLMYAITDTNNMIRTYSVKDFDRNAHLWTIQDAKDGDVLVSNYKPFIYNGNHDSIFVGAYCGISTENRFNVGTEKCRWTENLNIHPATKKQRDTLMNAMTDAGWQFDFEKKEMKKIKQKQAIDCIDSLIDSHPKDNWELVREFIEKFGKIPEDEDELNVLIEYVLKRQKPTEWGEEDEEKLRDVIRLIEQGAPVQSIRDHYTNWIKSLKERIDN